MTLRLLTGYKREHMGWVYIYFQITKGTNYDFTKEAHHITILFTAVISQKYIRVITHKFANRAVLI